MIDLKSLFESDYAPAGDGTALAWIRQESPRRTALFVGSEEGGDWRRLDAPSPIHELVAAGERAWLCTDDAVCESLDRGAHFTPLPLPGPGRYRAMVIGPDGPLVTSATEVLAREAGEWVVRWSLPVSENDQQISELRMAGDDLLVGTNRARLYRGPAGARELEDYGQGLPPPSTGRGSETVAVSAVDGWRFAYRGAAHVRRATDVVWSPLDERAPPELAGVAASGSADWVRAPWESDVWVGIGMALLEGGPGREVRRIWQAPEMGLHYLKGIKAGAARVMVSFRRATPALAGLSVREGGETKAIALPIA